MPQQTDSAQLAALGDINQAYEGRKLRVAGILSFEVPTSGTLAILRDPTAARSKPVAILVDLSICIASPNPPRLLRESRTAVTVLGHLESTTEEVSGKSQVSQRRLNSSTLQERSFVSSLFNGILSDPNIILRAVLVLDSQDLNFVAWNKAIRTREQFFLSKNRAE